MRGSPGRFSAQRARSIEARQSVTRESPPTLAPEHGAAQRGAAVPPRPRSPCRTAAPSACVSTARTDASDLFATTGYHRLPLNPPDRCAMPLIFSYGTLQQDNVQLSTFGRLLEGHGDELVGAEKSLLRIDDEKVVATSGRADHPVVRLNGLATSRVRGTVYEITDAELARADRYEVAEYKRVGLVLASGKEAWVYVDARSLEEQSTMSAVNKSGTFTLGGDRSVRRLGYGAMQLAGPGVFGPPKDRRGRACRAARSGGERCEPHRHQRLLRSARHQSD